MHLKRWITSIIGLPFLILLIWKGKPLLFLIFINLVCFFCMFEYYRIVRNSSEKAIFDPILILGFIFGQLIIYAMYINSFKAVLLILSLNLISCGFISLSRYKLDPKVIIVLAKQVQGMIYIPLFLSYAVLIRNDDDGHLWIFLVLAIIFAGDTGAYYVGSYFGKHKLSPSISPGKTIEGAIGGICANILVGLIFKTLFLPNLNVIISIIYFISAGIIGQIGDLFESELKRDAKIKDSGNILPGHGGILDRIDAVLFAMPITYLFKYYIF
ncbi:MAG: phosphatidate cytidylyltransferase [Desulfobacterales bacterium]|nr:phosphatidate cytidylyltransferase [Desulfobacterales bacterium]